jgi:glycosyltransferase involved in cell wall biosynthesis
MTEHPLVSVIIPVFNGERYLGAAIDSVLAQSHKPIELIVVDDGSTDSSAAVAAGFGGGVRVVSQQNAGIGAARNRGVAAATGSLLAFLDCDDLWAKEKLTLQVTALAANPALDFVLGYCQQFLDGANPGEGEGPPLPGNGPGAMLVRAESFARVGWFSTEWRVGEYIDWYGRAVDAGLQGRMLPESVLFRRLHADNVGRREAASRADYAKVLRAALTRRRAAETARE